MSKTEEPTCKNCQYADRAGSNIYFCRRNLPTYNNGAGVWPTVKGDDWCGKWRDLEPYSGLLVKRREIKEESENPKDMPK